MCKKRKSQYGSTTKPLKVSDYGIWLFFYMNCFCFFIVTISDLDAHKWIKLNKDQIGYYRVNYPVDMWKTLSDALSSDLNSFSVSDRAHLLNDAFSLAEATQLEYQIALNLTKYLANETEFVPWSVASSKILGLKSLLYYTDVYQKFTV